VPDGVPAPNAFEVAASRDAITLFLNEVPEKCQDYFSRILLKRRTCRGSRFRQIRHSNRVIRCDWCNTSFGKNASNALTAATFRRNRANFRSVETRLSAINAAGAYGNPLRVCLMRPARSGRACSGPVVFRRRGIPRAKTSGRRGRLPPAGRQIGLWCARRSHMKPCFSEQNARRDNRAVSEGSRCRATEGGRMLFYLWTFSVRFHILEGCSIEWSPRRALYRPSFATSKRTMRRGSAARPYYGIEPRNFTDGRGCRFECGNGSRQIQPERFPCWRQQGSAETAPGLHPMAPCRGVGH